MRIFPDELHEGGEPSRPPRYSARRVQYRLMVLVSMFMLVLLLMDKARDPRMWQWMWAGEPWAQAPSEPGSELPSPLAAMSAEDVDTKLPPQPAPTLPDIPDAISTAPRPLGAIPEIGGPEQRAMDDMWARLMQSLTPDEEELLDRAFFTHRHDQTMTEQERDDWNAMLPLLQSRGERHFKEAKRVTEHSTLGEQQQLAWLELIDQQRNRWEQQTLPALVALGAAEPTLPEHDEILTAVQDSLDRLAMANIKDNTVYRAAESRAWYRMLERLQQTNIGSLTEQQAERVGFLQLFRQPDIYRGKLVTLHGTAELAYRLKAPENAFGIEAYTVLWVRPTGGPSSPVVVYSLDLPKGFPEVADRDQPGQSSASTELSEEVDITGYYFKNWAYQSREGINTAPLMLAKMPRWLGGSPPPPKAAVTWLQIWLSIAATGLLATVLTLLAFRSSTLPQRADGDRTDALKELQQFNVSSPSEKLRRMSQQESSE